MLRKKTFESEVGSLLNKWAKDFRTDFFRVRPFTSALKFLLNSGDTILNS